MDYSESSSEWSEDDSLVTRAEQPRSDSLKSAHKDLDSLALHAFALGVMLCTAAVVTGWFFAQPPLSPQCPGPNSPHWRTPFFLASVASLHSLELWAITSYAPVQASGKHLRLGAGRRTHALAYAFATAECLVLRYILWTNDLGQWFPIPLVMPVGVALVVAGQVVHTLAIAHAGPAYLGDVRRRAGRTTTSHALVTTGIYGWLRHPAYFGYFWWAVGTQLVMANRLSLLGFPVVLWSFFAGRVRIEEEMLERIHGREYDDYRRRVGTWMPFVGHR
ncbi:protein-S-isoprenylcysteine O-methyltransferase [Microdochium nivale]|nr:protein-S-isoprenylcysteine O-methyltransferase [Microdochium nivale]